MFKVNSFQVVDGMAPTYLLFGWGTQKTIHKHTLLIDRSGVSCLSSFVNVRGQQAFYVKVQVVNSLGFVNHIISGTAIQFYLSNMKAATDNT